MVSEVRNKHATRSALTRQLFIETAQRMFADRSIDSVSLNEITVAAGQKNRNALQYHFDDREGLLQAIIDSHAQRVQVLRQNRVDTLSNKNLSAAAAAARALVNPIADYVEENEAGSYYVKILSQMAALNSSIVNPSTRSGLVFHTDERLAALMREAVAHLKPAEAQRRMFLTVSITFHSIADICRASESKDTSLNLKQRSALFDQVALSIESLLGAPAQTR
ncbi:MAG: AcrR family transcriptional regulator [Halioglobus sp.]|jgi:AcrR family transcriptional regulator